MVQSTSKLITGYGHSITVKEVSKLYRDNLSLASPASGKIQRLGNDAYSLTSVFKALDCDTLESTKLVKVYSLETSTKPSVGRCIESVRCVSDSYLREYPASVTSENGRFAARLRPASNGSKKQLLEIWDRSRHVKTIDTSELDLHGPINIDPSFGWLQWSPFGEQDKLLYICTRKQPKPLSWFQPEKPGQKGDLGQEHLRREDWGESLTDIDHTLVGIIDVANECDITTIDEEGYSLAEARWMDNGNKIVTVGYSEEPRRMGKLHCNNLSSKIVVYELPQPTTGDGEPSKPARFLNLTKETKSYHSIRVNQKGDKFIYLTSPVAGAHFHSVRLHIYDITTNEDRELVDPSAGDLFIADLPSNCFSMNDKNILFVSYDHLSPHMCLFNLDKNQLSKIKFPTTSVAIQDFRYDIILASGSEVNSTPTLFVATLSNSENAGELVAWHQIEECIHFEDIEYDQHKIPTSDGSTLISAILVSPNYSSLKEESAPITDHSQLPTVILVHGGPHNAFQLAYAQTLVFYARLGLKTVLINYRGSTGVSEEYLESLVGKIGQLDVEDCLTAIRYFVQNKLIDPSKLIMRGGSHGGFLSAHLCCQDEFKFTSAIISNPVIDVSTMYETSDIPHWCYTEALGHKHYDFTWMPKADDIKRMHECSPISKFTKSNIPTLMLLGNQDRRVPMFQGMRWIELLKARGVETMCKVYPDKHDLAKVDVAADAAMTSMVWILTHLNPQTE